ncbi:MAG: C40 family peptidase [Clostridium sp.]|uniref:C40 family peptidase n=1 Tax=Clostridium symbiosum TaxID=1512 RepID=UPI00156E3847|nr:C40 family peptidase [[Clostridium] symbiosum]NSF83080.1 C40 family peptidase [[Clostridium] symbiosum]NSI99667.1 C40 family peptidase [[Clostridium] symbiosum]
MTRGTNSAGDKGTSGQNVPKSPKGPKTKKSKFRMESEQEKISKSKLRMETREDKLNRARKKLEGKKPPKPRGPVRRVLGAAGWSAHGFVHGKIYEVEHENVGTEGAHRSELMGEAVGRAAVHTVKKRIREHPARAVHKAEAQYIKARADYQFRMAAQENPELAKNAITRYWHKQKLKKQYAKQARQAAKQTAKQGAKAAGKTAAATEKLAERAVAFVKRHPVGALIALACVVLVLSLQSCASSLISLGNAAAGAVGATTYPAQDGDMLGAEAAYCSLEAELQNYLDTYESTHDYDEYHFDLDAIEHDPYVLISLLSAWHEGEWTLADVQPTLQMLFDRQYTLTENVVKERRYYIETDTWTDEDGNTHTDSYRVYYDYFICYVTLDNFNLSHLPIYIMGEDKVSRYSLYMATLGNRPDLFPGSSYVGKYTSPPEGYEVPGEYLDDETFAAMLSEAEKYLGYPYVWGGSSPATSFDCSGFVSWVVNHSGWNVGRLGAQGLYNICTRTSSPRPGDLVFFKGTYDTPGVSHCGIYVGDGMMIHCGDPISYANLNSSYWQAHFYAYGRLP